MAKQDKTKEQEGRTAAEEAAAAATADPAKSKDDAKPKATKKVPALRIKAKVAGFRRAGLVFGLEPIDVPLTGLLKNQIAALKSEPMLIVEDVEIDA